jgi:hypothetical protein
MPGRDFNAPMLRGLGEDSYFFKQLAKAYHTLERLEKRRTQVWGNNVNIAVTANRRDGKKGLVNLNFSEPKTVTISCKIEIEDLDSYILLKFGSDSGEEEIKVGTGIHTVQGTNIVVTAVNASPNTKPISYYFTANACVNEGGSVGWIEK